VAAILVISLRRSHAWPVNGSPYSCTRRPLNNIPRAPSRGQPPSIFVPLLHAPQTHPRPRVRSGLCRSHA
jgi:hypothetical protein